MNKGKQKKKKRLHKIWHSWVTIEHHSEAEILTLSYKMRHILLHNMTAILLQNAIQVYCKIHQVFLLQNAPVVVQNRQLLQNETIS